MTSNEGAIQVLKDQLEYARNNLRARNEDVANAQVMLDATVEARNLLIVKINSLVQAIALLELNDVRRG